MLTAPCHSPRKCGTQRCHKSSKPSKSSSPRHAASVGRPISDRTDGPRRSSGGGGVPKEGAPPSGGALKGGGGGGAAVKPAAVAEPAGSLGFSQEASLPPAAGAVKLHVGLAASSLESGSAFSASSADSSADMWAPVAAAAARAAATGGDTVEQRPRDASARATKAKCPSRMPTPCAQTSDVCKAFKNKIKNTKARTHTRVTHYEALRERKKNIRGACG